MKSGQDNDTAKLRRGEGPLLRVAEEWPGEAGRQVFQVDGRIGDVVVDGLD